MADDSLEHFPLETSHLTASYQGSTENGREKSLYYALEGRGVPLRVMLEATLCYASVWHHRSLRANLYIKTPCCGRALSIAPKGGLRCPTCKNDSFTFSPAMAFDLALLRDEDDVLTFLEPEALDELTGWLRGGGVAPLELLLLISELQDELRELWELIQVRHDFRIPLTMERLLGGVRHAR